MTNSLRRGETVAPGHVLFRVTPGRVEEFARAFEAGGFTVIRGGPPHDLVNAMIYLHDGWFIELFGLGAEPRVALPLFFASFVDPPLATRFAALVGERRVGWLDWSVDVSEIEREREILCSGGVPVSTVRGFSRTQRDGTTTHWELAMPGRLPVPFLKSPYRGHMDVPASARVHANGVIGVAAIVIAVPDLPQARRELLLLGVERRGALFLGGVEVRLEPGPTPEIRDVLVCTHDGERAIIVALPGAEEPLRVSATRCEEP